MLRRALLCALTLVLVTATPAFAADRHHDRHHGHGFVLHRPHSDEFVSGDDEDDSDPSDDSSDDSTDTAPDAVADGGGSALSLPAGGSVATGSAQTITAQITGFSWQDNSPPGSSTVCCGVLHKQAGGTGTYADPITTAVPGSGGQGMETKAGTRIYVSRLKRYFVVEDSGATKMSQRHFDLWVDGQGFSKSASDKCMNSYTGSASVILNPAAGLPVTSGPLTGANGCVI